MKNVDSYKPLYGLTVEVHVEWGWLGNENAFGHEYARFQCSQQTRWAERQTLKLQLVPSSGSWNSDVLARYMNLD